MAELGQLLSYRPIAGNSPIRKRLLALDPHLGATSQLHDIHIHTYIHTYIVLIVHKYLIRFSYLLRSIWIADFRGHDSSPGPAAAGAALRAAAALALQQHPLHQAVHVLP